MWGARPAARSFLHLQKGPKNRPGDGRGSDAGVPDIPVTSAPVNRRSTKAWHALFFGFQKPFLLAHTREMVFGGYASKAPAFGLWTLFVCTKRNSPPGETWPCPCCLLLPLRGPPALVLLIGLDDPLDNDVSHHVRLSQAADGDVLHPFEHPHGFL